MKKQYLVTILIVILSSILGISQTQQVGGIISNNTIWSGDLEIVDDVVITSGTIINILPGTIVRFDGPFKIDMNGQILAQGTATDPIQFTSDKEIGWKGLRISNVLSSTDSSIIQYCNFEYAQCNQLLEGGALFINGFDKVRVSNCIFSENIFVVPTNQSARGAAIAINEAAPLIINNIFINNGGSLLNSWGGAISCRRWSDATISGNYFYNNSAKLGGAVSVLLNCNVNIESNIFNSNKASEGSALRLANKGATQALVYNNLFFYNAGGRGVIATFNDGYSSVIFNNTIAYNIASALFISSHYSIDTKPLLVNNIMFWNRKSTEEDYREITFNGGGVRAYNCIIENMYEIPQLEPYYDFNFTDDPLFNNPIISEYYNLEELENNWSLMNNSPAIDNGTLEYISEFIPYNDIFNNLRILGTNIDIGAIETILNKPPISNAAEDQTIECTGLEGTQIILDGSGSSDPDGDELTYTWYLGEDIVSGPSDVPTATLNLQLGTYTFTLEVNDGTETSTDEVVITVEDTTPPTLTVNEQYKIWPVNHKYVKLDIDDMISSLDDGCSGELQIGNVVITKLTSDEPEDDPSDGDGNTLEDMVIYDGCTSVGLRAERLGESNGRVYTVTLSIADASGNIGSVDFEAYVPHDVKDIAMKDEAAYFFDGVCEVPLPSEQLAKTTFENNNISVVEVVPSDYILHQNYPNPFNPSTTIKYSIPEDSYVTLGIYDALGNEVAQLENSYKSAGNYSYSFDASNLTSGIYFYTIRAGNFVETKKMLLMK